MVPANQPVEMTEEMDLQLAEEARQERAVEKEAAKKREPWEAQMEEDHPELFKKEEAKSPAKEQTDKAKKEEPEVEEKVEDKEAEEKKEEKVEEPKPEEKPEDAEAKAIQDWADKHSLTLDEAKDDYEKTKSIVGKYKSPEEMARALRLIQSERDKLKSETSKPTAQPVIQPAVQQDPRVEISQYVAKNAEKILIDYKRSFPAKSEIMSDEAILEDVADRYFQGFQSWAKQQQETVRINAMTRREEALSSLNDQDKQFLPMIKPVLMEMADSQVLSNEFNIQELIAWAKGKNFDKLIKEAEERGYKKAKSEGSKILGQIPQTSSENKAPKMKLQQPVTLSAYDRDRALEMYEGTTLTEEEKFQAYVELQRARKKQEKEK